ncbi:GTPase family protein [Vibrio ostreicida]|uniref:GTPase family protein n=1 Tax=Vibrio ostreicida TaxID=526588 RepID=UPI0009709833|nr:GTPase [Vibrio ostreicida]
MTSNKSKLTARQRYAGSVVLISLIGAVAPILLVSGFGIYSIIQQGYVMHLTLALLISTVVFFIPRWLWGMWAKRSPSDDTEDILVEASSDWSDAELRIWQQANQSIQRKLTYSSDWASVKSHGIHIAAEIAQAFDKKALDFTVPEGLQLLEEISRRYRQVLDQHVPAVDRIKVSQMKWLYEVNEKYGEQAVKLGKRGMLAWRVLRVSNPIAAIASELRGKLLGSLTDKVSDNLQRNAKQALLQEVAQVCIDLYSGRYTTDKGDIGLSDIEQQDHARAETPLSPIRIAIVGQISAGKSSLVNTLTQHLNAEVDPLPATDDIRLYRCTLEGEEQLNLIDTPGLDGSDNMAARVLEQITQSDLVLWVLKANQSSRQLDVTLREQVADYYLRPEHRSRKRPTIIGVLNQVDKLHPAAEWAPPYDLSDDERVKANTLRAALDYNRGQLAMDTLYPLGQPQGRPSFGLEALETEIQAQYTQAKHVQLNRRRNEAKGAGWKGQSQRLFKASETIIKNIL